MRGWILRGLALCFGVFLALRLGQAARDYQRESAANRWLRTALSSAEGTLHDLELEENAPEEEIRRRAFRQRGWVSPEDVVFFDGGKGPQGGSGTGRAKEKEEENFVWS